MRFQKHFVLCVQIFQSQAKENPCTSRKRPPGRMLFRPGLQNGRPEFNPRQRRKGFSSRLCVQTSYDAHPASYPMGTGDPFPGDKARPGRDADYSPPSYAEAKNE
jgi:hypothetical protein